MTKTCSECEKNPGAYKHPEDPEQRICRACKNRLERKARGLQRPGPKPNPTAKRSRHGDHREGSPNFVPRRKFATDTHCANGHEFIEESTYWRTHPVDGVTRPVCRVCERSSQRKYQGLPPIPDDTPFAIRNKDKTHCPQGHGYTEDNIYIVQGKFRRCKKCARVQQIRTKYGLEPEEFDEIMERQGHGCGICGDSSETLHVDHNHETGAVRGLLCNNCNNGLGRFEDSITRLQAAIRYLKT